VTEASRPRVRTVFIGTGEFAVPALRALAASPDAALVGVVTAPARPSGRRGELRPSPVESAAGALGVGPVLSPERLRRPHAVASVLDLSPELIVLADYGQIVPAALLDLRFGALNLHPSLLPRHRGAAPVPATIVRGDARTGVALMRMDVGLDTGPLVAVEEIPLRGNEVAPDLEADLARRGADLLVATLPGWIDGSMEARPQAADGATLTRPLRREDGRLDPTKPAADLERQVRAFQPWPGAWLDTNQERLAVTSARVADGDGGDPGVVRAVGGSLVLSTADGALELLTIQPAGRKPMSAEAFLRGRPDFRATVIAGPPSEPIERPVGYSVLP
jgi:methionyl-tRNA formyltransferase